MKKLLKGFWPWILIILTFGCLNPEADNSGQCVEGTIPSGFYRLRFQDCFQKSIWIEVSVQTKIGKDVSISIPSPVLHPIPDVEYKNVVEALITNFNFDETLLESLEGSPIFFKYRNASDKEISEVRSFDPNCIEVYENIEIPVIVITQFSFESCPKQSENQ
ncbi:hypothetical protein [Cecembia rubra]|uniref:hypothetical protein n=1 Tax=Cecembia rubra TaxID=1485585 RepID=UPI002714DE48|nr:hypothetical protein [Cecembia rubra]